MPLIHLADDIRYAIRLLLKRPLLLIAAVISIGIGGGLNVAVYSVLRHVMFDPIVSASSPETMARIVPGISYPNYRDLITFDNPIELAAMQMSTLTLRTGQAAQSVSAHLVSDNFFDVAAVHPALGSTFSTKDHYGADRVVITYEFWQRHFTGDPSVVGRTIELNGWPYVIIGVLPKGFVSVAVASGSVYAPIGPHVGVGLEDRRAAQFDLIGRLRNGVTREQALAALRVNSQQLETRFPDENQGMSRSLRASAADAFSFLSQERMGVIVLGAAGAAYLLVGLVLLVACANVASLLITRADERRQDTALRIALGATRGRIIKQFLAESLIISTLGCVAGALLWTMGAALLRRSAMIADSGITIVPESLPLGYCLILIAIVTTLSGIAPGLRSHRLSVVSGLKARGLGYVFGRFKLQNGIVAAQVSVCFVLLTAAVLLLQNVVRLQRADPGFDVSRTSRIELRFPTASTPPSSFELRDAIQSAPGVEAVTWGSPLGPPITTRLRSTSPADNAAAADLRRVGPRFMETMRIPLALGRDLKDEDFANSSARAVVVNEAFVRRFLPTGNPLGRQFILPRDSENGRPEQTLEIVGVAQDAMARTLGEDRVPVVFMPAPSRTVMVRTTETAVNSVRRLEQIVTGTTPAGVVITVTPLASDVRAALMPARVGTEILGALAVVGILLSMVGLYAIVNQAATQRRFEIGVRTALGATRASILRMIVRHSLKIVGYGCGIGCVVSVALMQVLQNLLADRTFFSPFALVIVIAVLIVLGIAASLLPALRSARIDPAMALRCD